MDGVDESVQSIARQVAEGCGNILSAKQCQYLSSKLSKAIRNVQELVSPHEASAAVAFQPALEEFQRIVEEARMLVEDCFRADWLKASVFQIRNEEAFREILLKLGLCYNVIYAQAEAMSLASGLVLEVEDLRTVRSPPLDSTFRAPLDEDVLEDEQTLRGRLEGVIQSQEVHPNDVVLAKYLLRRLAAPAMSEEGSLKVSSIMYDESTLKLSRKQLKETWDRNCKPLSKGSGAVGVSKTKWLGIKCAKKIFFSCGTDMNPLFEKEAPLLASINHPNIVKFFCCGISKKEGQCFIGMELMRKSLSTFIQERREAKAPFPIDVALDIIMQIARGMLHMHELGTAHRDLKPDNVGVSIAPNGTFRVKLLDFGLSKTKVQVSRSQVPTYQSTGTTKYRAPEVFKEAKVSKVKWFKADVYSFAITCYEILTLQELYTSIKYTELYKKLKDGTRPELRADRLDCPRCLFELIEECWAGGSNARPNFWSICERLEKFKHNLLLQGPGADSTKEGDQLRGENIASSSSYAYIETMLKRRSELRTPAKHPAEVVENEGATSEFDEGHINEGDECDDAAISEADEGAISEGSDGAISKGVELRTPAKHLAEVVENEGATSEFDEGHINEGDECDDAAISEGDEGAISEGSSAISKGVDEIELASVAGPGFSYAMEPNRKQRAPGSLSLDEACDKHMDRGFDLIYGAEGRGYFKKSLAEFELAANLMPNCPHILECCCMVEIILGNKDSAREYHTRASHNQNSFASKITENVHMLVWREFIRLTTVKGPLVGKQMEFKHKATLPAPEGRGTQEFRGEFHFSPAIQSDGENTQLTLTLEHAEIGVSNTLTEADVQGYFPYEFEMRISPNEERYFRHSTNLSAVKPVHPQIPQQVQYQTTTGLEAQLGASSSNFIPAPNLNFTVTRSNATSTSAHREVLEAFKEDEKCMRIVWKVNTYADGKPFVLEPVYKIRQLPYQPQHHVCTNSGSFQGKWSLPSTQASAMEFDFEWKVELVAKFALFRRTLKWKLWFEKLKPLTHETSHLDFVKSNFYQSSIEHNLQ